MMEPDSESWLWRTVYAAALALVVAAFLFSLRGILNPFLLFLLLLLLLSPFAGARSHAPMVVAAALLTLIWVLETTGFLLAPFFLSLGLAYVLTPVVRWIEGPRISRSLAVAILSLPILVGVALLVLLGIPALSHQIARLVESIPALLQAGVDWAERMQLELVRRDLPYLDEEALLSRLRAIRPEAVVEYLQLRQEEIARRVWQGILGAGRGISSVLTVLGYVFLTPILTFYLLRDYERIIARVAALVPRTREAQVTAFGREYDRLLSRYLRGQLLTAAAVGVATGVGFWLVGFPSALLLGVVAGVFNVVPYLGLIVSLVPAVIIALFSGSVLLSLGKIALVFGIVQVLDGSVISPRIVGESVGLHPVWVILALAVSSFFFGFVGLLLAIPLAVLVKLLLAAALARYHRSALFNGPHA